MTSREIAELVSSRHDDVKRSIERLAERGAITLPPMAEVSNDGPGPKTVSVFLVGKRDSYVIVAQLSPEFTARLVDRWQELEAQVTKPTSVTLTPVQALHQMTALMVEHEQKMQVLAAQSAEHSDKIKRIEAKQQAFEDGSNFFTVIGFAVWKGFPALTFAEAAKLGKRASALSRERDVLIDKVKDPRFGMVNAYHSSILEEVFAEAAGEM